MRYRAQTMSERPAWNILRQAAGMRRGAIGLACVGTVVLLCILGPLCSPHDPTAFLTSPFEGPGGGLLAGSDVLGRDAVSRFLNGGAVLMMMAAGSTIIAVSLGSLAGIASAYIGGLVDGVVMRSIDVLMALPQIVLALVFVSLLGPKLWLIVLVVGVAFTPFTARVMRSAAMDVAERDYVKAAELMGISTWRIGLGEILPALVAPLMVEIGLRLTGSMLVISGLAFLGFGQRPPAPNWGVMISENRVGLALNPWGVVLPVIAIGLFTVGANMYTDAISRAFAAGRTSPPGLGGTTPPVDVLGGGAA